MAWNYGVHDARRSGMFLGTGRFYFPKVDVIKFIQIFHNLFSQFQNINQNRAE
jgi:hypothetical protein